MRNRVLLRVDVVTKAFVFTLDFKSYVLLEIMQECRENWILLKTIFLILFHHLIIILDLEFELKSRGL